MLRKKKRIDVKHRIDRAIQGAATWNLEKHTSFIRNDGATVHLGHNGFETIVTKTIEDAITTWDITRGTSKFVVVHNTQNPFMVQCGEWIDSHSAYLMISTHIKLVAQFIELKLRLAHQELSNVR